MVGASPDDNPQPRIDLFRKFSIRTRAGWLQPSAYGPIGVHVDVTASLELDVPVRAAMLDVWSCPLPLVPWDRRDIPVHLSSGQAGPCHRVERMGSRLHQADIRPYLLGKPTG